MGLITSVGVRNFKCFREEVLFDLDQATFLIGPNNSGKSALLTAIRCFVDSSVFSPEFLNKAEYSAKKEGFNRSDIWLTFDLTKVTGRVRKKRLTDEYGNDITIEKSFTWREASQTLTVLYSIGKKRVAYEELDEDIQFVLEKAVAVSYIHPQEGQQLLQKAQDKFKQRLFHNWGRHASVAERVKAVEDEWKQLRTTANSYLSAALTARLQDIWPSSQTKVDLPENIQDIVAISDITFRSSAHQPEITLTSQGTGAQSTILYQTHYLLDSDRTLHPGMYFPIWLLEEPESFLHTDIAVQLGRLLTSDEWLNNIQMIITTHSPIILASARQNPARTKWIVFDQHEVSMDIGVEDVTGGDIERIGHMMGDANFDVYFRASRKGPLYYIEDSRDLTREKFEQAGLSGVQTLRGTGEVKKHLAVLGTIGDVLPHPAYFVVDGDDGKKSLQPQLAGAKVVSTKNGWTQFEVAANVFVLTLPDGESAEDLFDEWPVVLEEALDDLVDGSLQIRKSIPLDLSRAASELRAKGVKSRDEALKHLRRQQDVKDRFWTRLGTAAIKANAQDALSKFTN